MVLGLLVSPPGLEVDAQVGGDPQPDGHGAQHGQVEGEVGLVLGVVVQHVATVVELALLLLDRGLAVDGVHVPPLVDGVGVEAVVERGDVLQPVQPAGKGADKKKPTLSKMLFF